MSEARVALTGRRIAAVLTGFLAIVGLSVGTDVTLHASGVFPPAGQPRDEVLFALALAYRSAYGVLGSFIAARLAPDQPMVHALILGAVGLISSIAGAIATWHGGPAYGPHWYALALIALAMPNAWAGGALAVLQRARSVSAAEGSSGGLRG